MREEYNYPVGLKDDLLQERKERSIFWLWYFIPFFIAGVIASMNGDIYLGIAFIFGIYLLRIILEFPIRMHTHETLALHDTLIIKSKDNILKQIDHDRNTIAEIVLTEPYKVNYRHLINGKAIYFVKQGNSVLKFSSLIEKGEILVCAVLKQREWPPGSKILF